MRILMINLPYAGHTNPTLLLAKTLVDRGHEVFYINAEEFRSKIEGTGAVFVPFKNYPEENTLLQTEARCFIAAFDTAMQLDQKFDLLIYEMFFFPGIKIAENLGIPCVRQFSQQAWNQERIDAASIVFKLFCYSMNLVAVGRKKAAYMKLDNKTLLKAVAKDSPDLNIVYVPEVFQDKRDTFGDNFLYTLPVSDCVISSVQREIPYHEMKHPIVYISLGSIIYFRQFYMKCIKAFGNKPVSVILNTGKVSPESLGEIPKNIYAYSFVPQLEVLQHTDVFLTHCGMNSVNEAIAYGVPMVAMPLINDEISNADRIAELGIGKKIRFFPKSAKGLYEAVMEVATNPSYKDAISNLQYSSTNQFDMPEIASRIEALVHKTK